jgi:hypothetical protein
VPTLNYEHHGKSLVDRAELMKKVGDLLPSPDFTVVGRVWGPRLFVVVLAVKCINELHIFLHMCFLLFEVLVVYLPIFCYYPSPHRARAPSHPGPAVG